MQKLLTIVMFVVCLDRGNVVLAEPTIDSSDGIDVAQLPDLQGTVRVVHGNLDSFMPLATLDNLHLKWSEVQKNKSIGFVVDSEQGDENGNTARYIPLPGELRVASARYHATGKLIQLRLESSDDQTKVSIDIVVDPDLKRANLLITVKQRDAISGVAWIQGKYSDDFPVQTDD